MSSLAEQIEWFKIRDLVLGDNFQQRNLQLALALAKNCKHPDAAWVLKIFDGFQGDMIEEIADVFMDHADDPRGMCFAEAIYLCDGVDSPYDFELLVKAADLGYPFAQDFMVGYGDRDGDENYDTWLQGALANSERLALFHNGCFGQAAAMGYPLAYVKLTKHLQVDDPKRVQSCLIAAQLGCFDPLLRDLQELNRPDLGISPRLWFQAGQIFTAGSLPNSTACIFGRDLVDTAMSYYAEICQQARAAITTFLLCARRDLRGWLNKDLRMLIARQLWQNRQDFALVGPRRPVV